MIIPAPFRLGLAAALLSATGAVAGELCVVCAEPAASYRCQLEGTDPAAPTPPGAQVLCIKELATRGGHKSCSVSRDQTPAACSGNLVVVALPSIPGIGALKPPPKPSEPPPQIAGAPSMPPPAPQGPAAEAPPATMEALAKQAAKQTKQDLDDTTKAAGNEVKKAGDTVGSAVSKTWKCLSTLFTGC